MIENVEIPESPSRRHFRPSAYKSDPKHYVKVHNWIKKHKPLPEKCEWCGVEAKLQYANLSFEYKFELDDWACLCIICHVRYDCNAHKGRMRNVDIESLEFFLKNLDYCKDNIKPSSPSIKVLGFNVAFDYYKERMTYKKIGEKYNKSHNRIAAILHEYMRVLRNSNPFSKAENKFAETLCTNLANEFNLPKNTLLELRKYNRNRDILLSEVEKEVLKYISLRKEEIEKQAYFINKEKNRKIPRKMLIKRAEKTIAIEEERLNDRRQVLDYLTLINNHIWRLVTKQCPREEYMKIINIQL